jgi:amino acid adenylation domain-containing protein
LRSGFLRNARLRPSAAALTIGDRTWTYGELERQANQMAAAMVRRSDRPLQRVGIFAYRSAPAYAGVLAALCAGAAFVPLNRTLPRQRTRDMIEQADIDALIVDRESASQLESVLAGLSRPGLVLLPEADAGPLARFDAFLVLDAETIRRSELLDPLPAVANADVAYLLFTSGSTGRPKGVPVTHGNVLHFIDAMNRRYDFTPDDRFSQTFDQTFDVSVFDLFVAWESGASVHVPQPIELLAPHAYVRKHGITVWFSVPSVPILMRRKNLLHENTLPTLRWSLFAGEALPCSIASAWRAAAPASTLDNLYGPTEATIACLAYRWDDRSSPSQCVNGVVPIGRPLDGLAVLVVDENLEVVPAGEPGELCVSGPQTAPGYWRDSDLTHERFVMLPHANPSASRFYRTGDRVRQLADGNYAFLGRVDQQVKVLGRRVELGEIEAALRAIPRVEEAVAVAWPVEDGIAHGIASFVSGSDLDLDSAMTALRDRLPDYMVPRRILVVDAMPLNPNGKVDRKALERRLAEGAD